MKSITILQDAKAEDQSLLKSKANEEESEPLDLTASSIKEIINIMRGRSHHSTDGPQKGGPGLNPKGKDDKKNKDVKISNVSVKKNVLRTYILRRLYDNHFEKKNDGQYNAIIRVIADPIVLQLCYILIKSKKGITAKGINNVTLDGMELTWFDKISKELLSGKYKFEAAYLFWRGYIPKKDGSLRPLGIGSPREKIVLKAITEVLETIYEIDFLDCSHGFRPARSTHTALKNLYLKGHHHTWVIQGDITKCFDNIPHAIIMKLLKKLINCDRTLQLISKHLRAGYLDPDTKKLVKSNVGTPQGSVISPLLANIVLHELDLFIMKEIITEYTKGIRRATNKAYNKLVWKRYSHATGVLPNTTHILKEARKTPRLDRYDPNFRRCMYIRYADDFVILLEGTHGEAVDIKMKVAEFLKENCGLELNMKKTLVTHLGKGFKFLGADIKKVRPVNSLLFIHNIKGKNIRMRKPVRLRLNVPIQEILKKLIDEGFARRSGSLSKKVLAIPYRKIMNKDHATIVQFFNSKIRGLFNYYTFASNRVKLLNAQWILHYSLAKTLALKLKLGSAAQAFRKFGHLLKDPETGIEFAKFTSAKAIHEFNGKVVPDMDSVFAQTWSTSITQTNIGKTCTVCGTTANIQMHHLKLVANIRAKMISGKLGYRQWIGSTLRKQIPLCDYHHKLFHKGQLLSFEMDRIAKYTGNMTMKTETSKEK